MRLSFFLLPIVAIYGCSAVKEAIESKDQPACRSVVEVFLTADTAYRSRPPFLLLKRAKYSNDTRYLHGRLISMTDSGIVFERAKEAVHKDSKPEFFPLELVECLIDSNNQIAYGEWNSDPEVEWEVELVCQRMDVPGTNPFSLILEPNRASSYCLDPGEYTILSITFNSGSEYVHQSDTLCCGRFIVYPDAVTFLGSIHSEYTWNPSPTATIIPTFVKRHKGMGAIPAVTGGGLLSGLVGAMADKDILERASQSVPYHAIRVAIDSTYVPKVKNTLRLTHAPLMLK